MHSSRLRAVATGGMGCIPACIGWGVSAHEGGVCPGGLSVPREGGGVCPMHAVIYMCP